MNGMLLSPDMASSCWRSVNIKQCAFPLFLMSWYYWRCLVSIHCFSLSQIVWSIIFFSFCLFNLYISILLLRFFFFTLSRNFMMILYPITVSSQRLSFLPSCFAQHLKCFYFIAHFLKSCLGKQHSISYSSSSELDTC